ncbi:hypothetical protein Tco_0513745 [Tanacetum coccineum]
MSGHRRRPPPQPPEKFSGELFRPTPKILPITRSVRSPPPLSLTRDSTPPSPSPHHCCRTISSTSSPQSPKGCVGFNGSTRSKGLFGTASTKGCDWSCKHDRVRLDLEKATKDSDDLGTAGTARGTFGLDRNTQGVCLG